MNLYVLGHYCDAGTDNPVQCPPGSYTVTTQNSACLECPSGKYCEDGGVPLQCLEGFYCGNGTGYDQTPCPAGTYSSSPGLSEESQCLQCSGGFYCELLNSTSVTGPCDAGYYCTSGISTPTPSSGGIGDGDICPPGHYCPEQSTAAQGCPLGTFYNTTGATSEDNCTACSPGFFCDEVGLSDPVGPCDDGYYCTLGSESQSPSIMTANGGPCVAGFYCPEGSSNPIQCAAGTYTDAGLQAVCLDCPEGYYCEVQAADTTICPLGKEDFIY